MEFSALRKHFPRILIANRGEIACRIVRTCRRAGIRSIVIASEADRDALHAREADEVVLLPGREPGATYLNADAILEAAARLDVRALHPGYGFLSENADFAERVEQSGIRFIGPSPRAMQQLGDKLAARTIAESLEVPLLPGERIEADSLGKPSKSLVERLRSIGFPLLVKAAAGGGGRGMRLVHAPEQLVEALQSASREAKAFFSDGTLYVEKYLSHARHIEVQIAGDRFENVRHLFERDCSLQRNYQKVIEETPAPLGVPVARLRSAAEAIGLAAKYENLGTVEFLVDQDGSFAFLEVNSRLQVEHPVTEAVTGYDLVELQLQLAAGESLEKLLEPSDESAPNGHSIQCRICAEIPESGFRPATGTIKQFFVPRRRGLRLDSGVAEGDRVSPYYDSLLAKLIVHAPNRERARLDMINTLQHTQLFGVASNIPYLIRLLSSEPFRTNTHATTTAAALAEAPLPYESLGALYLLAQSAIRRLQNPRSTFARVSGWRLLSHQDGTTLLQIGESIAELRIRWTGDDEVTVSNLDGSRAVRAILTGSHPGRFCCQIDGRSAEYGYATGPEARIWLSSPVGPVRIGPARREIRRRTEGEASDILRSSLPGKVVRVEVGPGDQVTAGQVALVIESMKMEHPVCVPHDATIDEMFVQEGDRVDSEQQLLIVKRR